MLCAQLFKCPKWSHLEIDCFHPSFPWGCWMCAPLPNGSNSWWPGWSWLQTGDQRGDSWSAAPPPPPPPTPLPSYIQISPMHHPHSRPLLPSPPSLLSLWGPKLSGRGALGVKGVQADGQDLACRMLTIRQKTLIGFNWKSIMGLIASSPCCHPRMAPVIWGLHLVADQAVKYQTDGLITGAFMMRKIALKIQWAEPSRAEPGAAGKSDEGAEGQGANQTPPNSLEDHYSPIMTIRDRFR